MSELRTLLLTGLVILGMGCTASAPPPTEQSAAPQFADEYLIGIGDQLQVTVWRNPDLSVGVPVRPDGRISVPVVGDVDVGGLSPEKVGEVIANALSDYVRDPVVTVIVTSAGSGEYLSRVRITGAVANPASIPFRPGMTVLDIVLDAGGVSEFGRPAKTVLYRKGGERIGIRLDRILNKGDLSTNVYVQPGDVITVPESVF